MSHDNHTCTFYLCVRRGARQWAPLQVRTTHKQPSLEPGEISIAVNLSLPRALFQKPILKASIEVPSDGVSPAVIEADVINSIADVVKQNLGLDMTITLGAPENT